MGENDLVRRNAGIKRVDRRSVGDPREELCIEKCLVGRLDEAKDAFGENGRRRPSK